MRDPLAVLLPEPQDLPAIDELPDPFLRPDGCASAPIVRSPFD